MLKHQKFAIFDILYFSRYESDMFKVRLEIVYQQCCKIIVEFSSERSFEIAGHLPKLRINVW